MIVSQPTVPAPMAPGNMELGGPSTRVLRASWQRWLPFAVFGVLLAAIYAHVAVKLVYDWYTNPDFSHGFLVPLFSAFLIWTKRKTLRQMRRQETWAGLPLVIAGIFTLFLGIYGAELFLSRISIIMLLAGLVWMFCGRAILHEVRFALLVLLLAIPFPEVVYNQLTFPLQILASKLASAVLPWFGVPVLRDGNVIQLPSMQLEVAEACSGIRSLMSLFTAAVFYGYFLEPRVSRRVLLALAAIPIAVFANGARIVGTGLGVQYWSPEKALGFFHEFSGWLIFIVSLCCLYLFHTLMQLGGKWRSRR